MSIVGNRNYGLVRLMRLAECFEPASKSQVRSLDICKNNAITFGKRFVHFKSPTIDEFTAFQGKHEG